MTMPRRRLLPFILSQVSYFVIGAAVASLQRNQATLTIGALLISLILALAAFSIARRIPNPPTH